MDFDALIAEIVSRVAEKMAEPAAPCVCGDNPKLLVLTQQHGEACHAMLDSSRLSERYQTVCALLNDNSVDVSEFEGVLLYNLTVEALTKLAGGCCDTPYTALASKAILLGKKLWVPCDQVELFRYEATAPAPYYGALREKLSLLEQSGLIICNQGELEDAVLGAPVPCVTTEVIRVEKPVPAAPPCVRPEPCGEACITKKVITEKDITAALAGGARRIKVGKRSILTDLAKDLAHNHKADIVRE